MSDRKPLLVEIGCEELPPKALDELAGALAQNLREEFAAVDFPVGDATIFCSPRRLAVSVADVAATAPKVKTVLKAMPVKVGWDEHGQPTAALVKRAAALGVAPGAFRPESDAPNATLVADAEIGGGSLSALLPLLLEKALKRLPIPKPMRWSDHDYAFVRPVHWIVILHGDQIIDAEVFGVRSGRQSRGHRFHHPQPVHIANAESYVDALRAASVLADPGERRDRVRAQVERVGAAIGGKPRLREELLSEIANLTEWPVAIACTFDREFLRVPQEALIQTMETNQKFVPVFGADGRLTEHFIGVANIESKDPAEIRKGYERVIRPRFADAKFFYDEDLKTPLAAQQEALKSVTYQQQLGSVWDKCLRVIDLSRVIANRLVLAGLDVDAALATRAAALSKCDLMTRMVGEFPELQGVMGRYYARANGENAEVSQALDEFYKPRFAGDDIAAGKIAQVLAVAERVDTLAGIFAVGLKPSGNKDPFALRRAALGLGRTLIEGELDLNLEALLREALELLPKVQAKSAGKPGKEGAGAQEVADAVALQQTGLSAQDKSALTDELRTFVFERLRGYYADQGFGSEQFDAVGAVEVETLIDFDRRLRAVAEFSRLADAQALAAANKRIGNILRQAGGIIGGQIDAAQLDAGAETDLHAAIGTAAAEIDPLVAERRYVDVLRRLAMLREPIDRFFDNVMVMADDAAKRGNRLVLLGRLRSMFLHVADISLLPVPERTPADSAAPITKA
ncbi:MAG TPA: glycine--tRNA ligase subunit beta [Rhodanobacteraceae bacterium]|jgi:glycyl-tRNA synthetase beta chain|nr:glycine--tRNA ligase subunit beta [Rhodanobacteraceae bacterium]